MRLIILFFYYIIFNGINNKCKKTVVGKSKEKKQFLSGRRKWKDNIKMKLQDIGYQVVPALMAGEEPTKGSTNTFTKLFVYKTNTRTYHAFPVIDHLVVDSAH